MEKIIKSALLLLCGACLFTACDDDRDNNPTIQQPKTFVLNTPSYSTSTIDLATSKTLNFSWSQPDYGYPALANYAVQISCTNSWTQDIAAGVLDANEQPVGDYTTMDQDYQVVTAEVSASDIAKAIQKMAKYQSTSVPATQELYVRVRSALAGDTIFSNTVKVKVAPYYVELKAADPIEWYLVGSCIGDGSWGNAATNVYTSLVPLYTIDGIDYDKTTGAGSISYTTYLPAGGKLKIIKNPGSWDTQIGYTGFTNVAGNANFEEDSDGNLYVNTGGFYTITVNTASSSATIEEYGSQNPTVYSSISLTGSFNGWDTAALTMTPMETFDGAVCHNWTCDITVSEDAEFKFTDGGSAWWGTDAFPYGTAGLAISPNGTIKAGSYHVIFNDITGQFYFMTAE